MDKKVTAAMLREDIKSAGLEKKFSLPVCEEIIKDITRRELDLGEPLQYDLASIVKQYDLIPVEDYLSSEFDVIYSKLTSSAWRNLLDSMGEYLSSALYEELLTAEESEGFDTYLSAHLSRLYNTHAYIFAGWISIHLGMDGLISFVQRVGDDGEYRGYFIVRSDS